MAQALKTVARRPADLAARYGGEEFALILPGIEQTGAIALGERLRQQLQQLQLPHEASTVSPWVTVSIGVTTLPGEKADWPTIDALVQQTDRALYQANQVGRDRVCSTESIPKREKYSAIKT